MLLIIVYMAIIESPKVGEICPIVSFHAASSHTHRTIALAQCVSGSKGCKGSTSEAQLSLVLLVFHCQGVF